MKRIIALILSIILCVSLCACGERDITSPGSTQDETSDKSDNDTISDDVDNSDTVDESSEDDTKVNEDNSEADDNDSETQGTSGNSVDSYTDTPESDEKYTFKSGDLSVNINYAHGMIVTEQPEEKMASIEYSKGNTLYVKDVTGVFDPDANDPSSFLYEYAYQSCLDFVTETYGEVEKFNGEFAINVSGNELYGYGAHMTCDKKSQVYAFIKLISLDNGYVVTIGVCDESNMYVFDNIRLD